jgi:sporulation-control protein spo0M
MAGRIEPEPTIVPGREVKLGFEVGIDPDGPLKGPVPVGAVPLSVETGADTDGDAGL